MQIKSTLRFHFTPVRIVRSIKKQGQLKLVRMWERGHPSIGGGSADLYSRCGNHMQSLRKLGRDTLWGTNPEGASSYLTDTPSSMFIAALFITEIGNGLAEHQQ